MHEHGSLSEQAYLFPSRAVALRCVNFIHTESGQDYESVRIVDLYPNDALHAIISAVLFPAHSSKYAKAFWQHTGAGISSRQAEYCHQAFVGRRLSIKRAVDFDLPSETVSPLKGPRRYTKESNTEGLEPTVPAPVAEVHETTRNGLHLFVEERFGRNLDIRLAESAKLAIRRRIANALVSNALQDEASKPPDHHQVDDKNNSVLSADDVYLFPCGMNAIFHAHQLLMACRGEAQSISYGYSEPAPGLAVMAHQS